ncbi:MAG: hypothetical protein M1129_04380 [Candidatus Thermoplasmatota archaeon]|nr:hypothetical protein [Candidatus Thermoplasmatota archaeon]MCL5955440.1 hypothetical protein [Candidatus Thermoplasmatota archaeon]
MVCFFAGLFSFSEDFLSNTPFIDALKEAAVSPNFWMSFLTFLFAEWKIGDLFQIKNVKLSGWKVYSIGVIASYLTSFFIFYLSRPHLPTTGTSVIAFTALLTYYSLYPFISIVVLKRSHSLKDPRIANALLSSFFGFILILSWQFETFFGTHLWTTAVSLILPVIYFVLCKRVHLTIENMVNDLKDKEIFKDLFILWGLNFFVIFWQLVIINPSRPLHLFVGLFCFGVIFFEIYQRIIIEEFRKVRISKKIDLKDSQSK